MAPLRPYRLNTYVFGVGDGALPYYKPPGEGWAPVRGEGKLTSCGTTAPGSAAALFLR